MAGSFADISRPAEPAYIYRPDIDGLRAIAVLSVVAFHAGSKSFAGGFIGVDVFFVISGYLISSLILVGLRDGTFSYFEFYARRFRRIFPALTVVLICVWILGWFFLDPTNFVALNKHILAGAAFAANIVTYSEVGYFDAPAASKPLLHLWSLGVEEQFYLVFPVLLVLVWRYRAANLVFAAIAIVSFALNVVTVRHSPSFAFYLPLSRFWEFLAGTLLAHCTINQSKGGQTTRFPAGVLRSDVTSAMGMLMIAIAIFITPATNQYPGWWALLPVTGTALIIWTGKDAWLNRRILSDRKLVYIGLISYPLYLWHWPLLVIGRAIMRDYSPLNLHERTTTIAVVAMSLVLSWATFEFVERPIRARRPAVWLPRIAGISAAALVAVALIAVTTLQNNGFPGRYPKEIRALLAPLTSGADYSASNENTNSEGPLLVLYGDSFAGHLSPGLTFLQNERAFRFKAIGWESSCAPVADVKPADTVGCQRKQIATEQELIRLKPDIVVIGAFWRQYAHIERLSQTLRFLQRIGVRRLVVVGMPPFWPEPLQMLLYKAMRSDPLHRIPDRLSVFYPDSFSADHELKTITANLDATFISSRDIFCNGQGCLVRTGDEAKDILQTDRGHFSVTGSWYLVSRVADEILGGISTSRREPVPY